jgi:glycosyltransferase involved in cell wall biosynthesis
MSRPENQPKRVVILEAVVKQYRFSFLQKLHAAMRRDGIELKVLYSNREKPGTDNRDNVELPLEFGVKVPGRWLLGNRLFLQSGWREVAGADLVVLEQASKYLINYPLLAASRLGWKRVAYWGHGRNRQAQNPRSVPERLKRASLNAVDWWFAYTAGTAEYLVANGVPAKKITVVRNAVDTNAFRAQLAAVTAHELDAARADLGLAPGTKVGLFCGGMYPEKSIPFLLESARLVKRELSEFELVMLGTGPDACLAEAAARAEAWIHYLGPKFGREKARYFKLADVFLMPGLVGLAILDAFTAGLPLVTSDVPGHGPEVEYLEQGRNGFITAHDKAAYARSVARLIAEPALLQEMKEHASESATRYSVEAMVENFRAGIHQCLGGAAR